MDSLSNEKLSLIADKSVEGLQNEALRIAAETKAGEGKEKQEELVEVEDKPTDKTEDMVKGLDGDRAKDLEAKDHDGKVTDTEVNKIDNLITNKFPNDEIPKDGYSFDFQIIKGEFRSKDGGILDGTWDFIISNNNQLKLGNKHIFLANKMPVKAAGRIMVYEGRLQYIFNLSGHYRPTIEEAINFGDLFKQIGINVNGAELTIYEFKFDDSGFIIDYKTIFETTLK